MAHKKHLEILSKGVGAWNDWRKRYPEIEPDLFQANLSGMNLSEADLIGTQLTEASLSGTNLAGANLTAARLSFADLSNADLSRADLYRAIIRSADIMHAILFAANLSEALLIGAELIKCDLRSVNLSLARLHEADLSFADLSNADLSFANLSWVNLSYANLRGAILEGTQFGYSILGDTDLSDTVGIESCSHGGPSIIDIQTLAKSGRLPLNFLRGCGLPDIMIEYLPSILNEPIQFNSCFISYSSVDQVFVERLHADLQNKGIRCWFAPEDLKIGDRIRSRIDESIQVHDKLLLVLSRYSIASEWVEKEVETAMEREREQNRTVLFPIRVDDEVMKIQVGWAADIKRTRHIGDFRNWEKPDNYQKAIDRLLRDLKIEVTGGLS